MIKLEIFKAPWCAACPSDEELSDLKGFFNVKVYNLEKEESMTYANNLRIKTLPTFITEDGRRYFNLNEVKNLLN